MQRKTTILSLLLMFLCYSVSAQYKYEKEHRLPAKDVPQEALDFVDKIMHSTKHKWYLEQGLETHSYEMKTKISRKKYSIEFDKEGKLEDAEILIKFKSIPIELRNAIVRTINDKYGKYKIKKTQRQLSGSPEKVIRAINENTIADITVRYELIIKAKSEDGLSSYELLLDNKGMLLSQKQIVEESIENLEF